MTNNVGVSAARPPSGGTSGKLSSAMPLYAFHWSSVAASAFLELMSVMSNVRGGDWSCTVGEVLSTRGAPGRCYEWGGCRGTVAHEAGGGIVKREGRGLQLRAG